jgi:hypothetical protein
MNITQITLNYLNARQALDEAEKAKAQAEAELKQAYALAGLEFNVMDGQKVALVNGERPKYDIETLTNLVSPAILKKVTKTEVDGKKFKAGIEVGLIKPEVAEAVTTVTNYQQVRVTDLAKSEEASDAEKIVKIA